MTSPYATQVRKMRKEGITILLAHENDTALGGCEFATFFRTTPEVDQNSNPDSNPNPTLTLSLAPRYQP